MTSSAQPPQPATDVPSVVTPQEARLAQAEAMRGVPWQPFTASLLHTVATEPERIAAAERAVVVKALRESAHDDVTDIIARADAIESGADY